jgi:mono/diheme cytochrome c family protein
MWRRKGRSCIAVVLVLVGICPLHAVAEPSSSIVSSDPDTLAHGQRLFARNCSACHGKQAAGENPATPMGGWTSQLGHVAPALNGTGHAWHHPPEYLFHIIRDGSTLKGSRMQGWAKWLNEYDIRAVIAHFQSLWSPRFQEAYRHRYLHRVER